MRIGFCYRALFAAAAALLVLGTGQAMAQFTGVWLDIGEYHHIYVESGARHEISNMPTGMDFPAIRRESSHGWAKAFWIGTKDWTDPEGRNYPTYVSRIGPRGSGNEVTFPVQNKLVSRFDDPIVEVDGAISFNKIAIVDEVDPSLASDRMIHNIHNMLPGITVDRKIYAWANEHQDHYHLIDFNYCNTGNTDDDDEIELPNQTLKDVYFFRIHRWRGNAQEAWVTGDAQTWGKFSMIDVVGDGHAEYPLDFTVQMLWPGYNPDFTQYNNLGGALFDDSHWTVAEGDGRRLAGGDFTFRGTLHADTSPSDNNYIRCTPATLNTCQPHTLGFMDQDEVLTSDGSPHEDYYRLGILTRENPEVVNGGSSQQWPHYADRVQPDGKFWEPTGDASSGKQGGHAPTTAYGPYTMGPGECVNILVAEGVAGLSAEARGVVGAAYVDSNGDDNLIIEYDADGDGVIDTTPFDWDTLYEGSEALTKNQWVMTSKDSTMRTMQRADGVWRRTNNFSQYPILEPPRPPSRFSVWGRPDKIEMTWDAAAGGPPVTTWEIYRTSKFEDNLPYRLVASLPGGTNSFDDTDGVVRGTEYYYYIQGIGAPQPVDPLGITGTPGGEPLRSGRYYTQTYQPAVLKRPPGRTIGDARIVPNPINLGSESGVGVEGIEPNLQDRIFFLDIPGQARIRIFSELGEFIKEIIHTDESGDEVWNLTTDSRQLLVSGIYIAVIEDMQSGEQVIQKFAVIR